MAWTVTLEIFRFSLQFSGVLPFFSLEISNAEGQLSLVFLTHPFPPGQILLKSVPAVKAHWLSSVADSDRRQTLTVGPAGNPAWAEWFCLSTWGSGSRGPRGRTDRLPSRAGVAYDGRGVALARG